MQTILTQEMLTQMTQPLPQVEMSTQTLKQATTLVPMPTQTIQAQIIQQVITVVMLQEQDAETQTLIPILEILQTIILIDLEILKIQTIIIKQKCFLNWAARQPFSFYVKRILNKYIIPFIVLPIKLYVIGK